MYLLTATTRGQGDEAGDFAYAVPGEDGGCGCGRSFTGLASGMVTTTAVVAEWPGDLDDLRVIVGQAYAAWPIPDHEREGFVADLVSEMIEDGARYPLGTVVRRDRFNLDAAPGCS